MKSSSLASSSNETTTPASSIKVVKRNGEQIDFDFDRIVRAISLAMYAVAHPNEDNPHRDSLFARYGLTEDRFGDAVAIAREARDRIFSQQNLFETIAVEEIQNFVEKAILYAGEIDVARAYIAYRATRNIQRLVEHKDSGIREFIAVTRYCRFSEEKGRHEVWDEAIDRVRNMHLRKFPGSLNPAAVADELVARGDISPEIMEKIGKLGSLRDEIIEAFEAVKAFKVLPSMRSLQFGGRAIEVANGRIFNCSASVADRVSFFREYLYLLLLGCGVGFSVQKHHVAKLPPLAQRPSEIELPVEHHEVGDTIEGWCDALDKLIDSFVKGYKVEFSYMRIRPRGSLLRTSGGRAPGHLPLKYALTNIEEILIKAAGRRLRPIEVYDICMHAAQAVLAGGIRRSATICLFSADDEEMMTAKTGNWFATNPQRSASNNSAVLVRGKATREQFDKLFECQKQFGEPGFYFSESEDYVTNPCVEIGLNPYLEVTSDVIQKLRSYGYEKPLNVGDRLSGFQMCNLSTMNGRFADTPENFYRLCRWAAIIGTLQASYTDIPYLGPVTRILNERESLLGVSICGILDNPNTLLDPEVLETGAAVVKAVNAIFADTTGIPRAARTTCVKPEGTASLLLGTGSGIHPHHARHYFRRVQANTADPVYKYFRKFNPHMCEKSLYDKTGATDVITFPVSAPENSIVRKDVDAMKLLNYVTIVQKHWVQAGRCYDKFSPGLHHNVSNTITVRPDEWDTVADFIWENQSIFTGVAMLSESGDKDYPQAPREEVVTEEDRLRWNSLVYNPVDYRMIQEGDVTSGSEHRGAAVACSGGACELSV